ncbi:MAG: hypothetical protein OXT69_04185 [Candidatus Poribacteria bacterium]|nr:hypothetical protein [Candidatus Poribacteria bacterium]
MPELRTSEDGRLSAHFGDFDESVKKISEAAEAFADHLDPSAEAMRELWAAVLSAKEMFDAVKDNIAHTNMLCRLLKKAHEHLSEAIRLTAEVDLGEAAHSFSARFYTCRGIASLNLYRLGGSLADALNSATADLVKSIELDPAAETYTFLAHAYAEADKLDDAMKNVEKAIRLDIDCAEAYLLKGLIHRARGEEEDAHEEIFEAISLNPNLYRGEFEPIMEAERESEAIWDELLSRPEADAALKELEDEARAMLRSRKS